MTHAYTGKPLRSRVAFTANTVIAHIAWWAAFGFAAAMVLGLVG